MFGYVFSGEIQHFLLSKEFLKVKLPTIWTDGKAEVGRIREEKGRREKRKSKKKEDAGARKGKKLRNTVFFPWFVAPEGRKAGSLKRGVRSHMVR